MQIVALAQRRLRPRDEPAGARTPQTPRAGRAPLLCRGDPAVPRLFRRARASPRRRAPLRARRPRHDLRRLDLVAPVPRSAREARPRLRGRLLHRPVHRARHGRDVRRHPRRQRRRGLQIIGTRARRAARRRCLRRRALARQGARQGPHGPRPGVDRGADVADRAARPLRRAAALARRDDRRGSTRSAREEVAELARELYDPDALGRLHRRRRGPLPRRRSPRVSEALAAAA